MLLWAVITIVAPATSSELTDAKKTTSTFLWTTEHSGVRSPTTHRNKREARCWIVNLLSTFLFKARPYLASRILGYHNRPWVPPIIIATDQRGPKRYQTSSRLWFDICDIWCTEDIQNEHPKLPERTKKRAAITRIPSPASLKHHPIPSQASPKQHPIPFRAPPTLVCLCLPMALGASTLPSFQGIICPMFNNSQTLSKWSLSYISKPRSKGSTLLRTRTALAAAGQDVAVGLTDQAEHF